MATFVCARLMCALCCACASVSTVCGVLLRDHRRQEEQLPHGFVTCAVVSKEEHLFEQCLKSLLGWFHTHWPVTDADYAPPAARPCGHPPDRIPPPPFG